MNVPHPPRHLPREAVLDCRDLARDLAAVMRWDEAVAIAAADTARYHELGVSAIRALIDQADEPEVLP